MPGADTAAVSVGLQLGTQPPLGAVRAAVLAARAMRLESVMVIDHFQNVFPQALWNRDFTWVADRRPSPHEFFDYQVLLGYLAPRTGGMRLGVGVTESVRRHPVLIAQAMLTVSHLTKSAPILGIGAGERMNIDPYGFDFSHPVDRLAEALQVIRLCLSARGPISFSGSHFHLDRAVMDLKAPPGRCPQIWVGGHGPRLLGLAGRFGDGWYPAAIVTPQEYADGLAAVRTAAAQAGRDGARITPALHRFVVFAPSETEARAMLRHRAIRLLGLGAPARVWERAGAVHPLGPDFNAIVDFVPDRHDPRLIEDAIATVPEEVMTEGSLLWGTPAQVTAKLRAFGDAGLRHVVLAPVSGLVSKRAALYGLRATGAVARALARGRPR